MPDVTQPPDTQHSDSDAILVSRAQLGDTEAFDALVRRNSGKLHAMILRMTSDEEDAHDLVQEVFAKAYHSLPHFRGKSSFYTWIYQIGVNMTLNFLKKRKRLSGVGHYGCDPVTAGAPGPIDTTHEANPEQLSDLHELQECLDEALGRLSEAHRTVVSLFDIQGLPHAEIARILRVSEGTVRSRLHYAHRQMQTHLVEFHD